MRSGPTFYLAYFFLGIIWLIASGVHAQDTTPAQKPKPEPMTGQNADPELTVEAIEKLKERVAGSSLSDEEKAEATSLYGQAAKQIELANQLSAQIEAWKKHQANAPAESQKLTAELTKALPTLDNVDDKSLAELDQILLKSRQDLKAAEERLEDVKTEITRREDRRAHGAEILQAAKQRIDQVEKALKAPAAPGVAREISEASALLQRATLLAAQQEQKLVETELPVYDATQELLGLEEQVANRTFKALEARVEALTNLTTQKRRELADEQVQQAKNALENAPPELRDIAQENLRFAELRIGPTGLAAKIRETTQELQRAKAELEDVHETKVELTEKLELPRVAAYAGQLLREAYQDLPRFSDLERSISDRRKTLASERIQMSDLRRKQSHLADTAGDDENTTSKAEAEFIAQQKTLLEQLSNDHKTYFQLLSELNTVEQERLTESLELKAILDDHLMWLRAHGVLSWSNLVDAVAALGWVFHPNNWWRVLMDSWKALQDHPLLFLSSWFVFLVLAFGRSRFRRRLDELGEQAGSSYLVPFRITTKAFWFTILLTWLWPSLVFGIGWSLYSSPTCAEFTRAVGAGLLISGTVYVVFEFTRRLLAAHGLAEAHFRWTDRRIRSARRNLTWLTLVLFPLVFFLGHIQWEGNAQREDSLGRVLFVAGMIATSVFLQRVLRPLRGKGPEIPDEHRSVLANSSYRLAVALPLFVAGLSFVGYHYTALQLAMRVLASAWLGLGMLILHGLAARWLWLVRGQLALEQVQVRKETRKPVASTEESAGEESIEPKPEIDLPMVNRHTRQLLQIGVSVCAVAGIWWIWLDVIPGSEILERPVWSSGSQVELASANDGEIVRVPGVVTISDLLLAAMVFVIAIQIVRYIPGLVEVGLPHDNSLDAGVRYAISTIIRYVFIALMIVTSSSLLGIGWSRVQWLVAALSVGVGFGLQELVGNFISGVLLLFERPVRVGDIVTFDGVTGKVTRVQIRATTVRNWDQQDYIIPNKDLITGRVLNWTLSGELNRIVIPVGVSYDSDPRQVRELLFQILKEQPGILQDPAPLVTFEEFGDSTLNFIVRAYLATLASRLELVNELHTVIHRKFAEHNIEIAYPQRDLHLRTITAQNGKDNSPTVNLSFSD